MILLSLFLRRAATSIHSLYATRTLSAHFATADAKRTSAKTVKAFVDLPTGLVRPDGTLAEPLPGWSGGPDDESQSRSNVTNVLGHELDPPPKRRRIAKTVVLDRTGSPAKPLESDELFSAPSRPKPPYPLISGVEVKPKRGRKLALKDEASTALVDHPQPTNDEPKSISKPRRGRKAKVEPSESSVPLQQQSRTGQPSDGNGQPQTVLAQEILENLRRFPRCLLLTRVGQFYESYFDQAVEIARLLNIKLTTRKWGGSRVPMCGFPLVHLDKHLKVLVQQNKRFVAMCEEFPHYSDGVKAFDRRVSRVITPGTLIDEPFLNPFENNYLLAITAPEVNDCVQTIAPLGLAWIDVSTGEFFSKTATIDSLRDELARIGPKEVVLHSSLDPMKHRPIFEALAEDDTFFSSVTPPETFQGIRTLDDLRESRNPLQAADASTLELDAYIIKPALSHAETSAICLLTAYLHSNLLEHMPVLSSPNHEGSEGRMQIDSHTIKALEIRESFREGGTKGSLLSVIKRTVTSGGSRLLSRWLCSPSTSIAEINARQSLVAFFHARPHFQADLVEALVEAEDTGRIVQKFLLGRGDTSDLLAVQRTSHIWSSIMKRVEDEKKLESIERADFREADWDSLDRLMSRMVDLGDLSERIGEALEGASLSTDESATIVHSNANGDHGVVSADDSNVTWRYGPAKWVIKPGFSSKLMTLHNSLRSFLREREELERTLQLQYDAPSLTLRASPAHGMHVHLGKAKRDQAKLSSSPEFVSIAESGSTRCYFFREWSCLGGQIAETMLALTLAEKEAFETLRNEVTSHSLSLRRNAQILDELDVALSFAKLAAELNFVRPILTNDALLNVTNGRHPTVELGLLAAGRVFTPNSVSLSPGSRLHVITGPNMAGKSTFLRQTALITILAQTGSFVPADCAVIGVVDKLFSRIGAKDDLFHDRSTFMVEMLETAEILRRATSKSLVIMDEVGRGTTVTDGLAIAYATLHHLVTANQCRTLFATHFHELSDMVGYPNQSQGIFASVDFFCTDVDETDDDHFAYQYRVRPGVNRDSHGLKVAQLAGMPSAAVTVARSTLSWLKKRRPNSHDENMQ
ncbi:putative DNA-binding domain of DNA mismatch repair MUTS family protein [Lyophyllum shimeji]|uniref:DNA-binding domain of DNA mismatch repair MUTS family protein n=1 Tax=Lyophyllum shimeji TaxID=47721 RepID=A0A9P3UK66_LYOSH|nr:putative DNA-binding domain of DNA mismatch repair MUTS family protein [Lyophyllum shimeji]